MADVVLVHGALHGPWCWDGVALELQALDIRVHAPELPFTSFADDVSEARRCIEQAGTGVIVCGHSYGGMVVSDAARGLTQVNRLMYLAALMTEVGESMAELVHSHPTGFHLNYEAVDGRLEFDLEQLRAFFYADSDPARVAAVAPLLRPMVPSNWVLTEEPAWKKIPSTYVVSANDHCIHPTLQRKMAERADEVLEWPTDHSPFLTRPREIAALLAGYAETP